MSLRNMLDLYDRGWGADMLQNGNCRMFSTLHTCYSWPQGYKGQGGRRNCRRPHGHYGMAL